MSAKKADVENLAAQAAPALIENPFEGMDFEKDRDYGSPYPIINVNIGQPSKESDFGAGGCFFWDNDTKIDVVGATPYEHKNAEGKKIPGFAVNKLRMSVVEVRRCWTVKTDKGIKQRFPQSNDGYELAQRMGKPRGSVHILGYIEGCEDLVCVTASGIAAGILASGGQNPGILQTFGARVVMAARKLFNQPNLPRNALYVELGFEREADGTPKYTVVGKKEKSSVCMPCWLNAPKDIVKDYVSSLYVGHERAKLAQLMGKSPEVEAWKAAWNEETLMARVRKPKPEPEPGDDHEHDVEVPGEGELPPDGKMAY